MRDAITPPWSSCPSQLPESRSMLQDPPGLINGHRRSSLSSDAVAEAAFATLTGAMPLRWAPLPLLLHERLPGPPRCCGRRPYHVSAITAPSATVLPQVHDEWWPCCACACHAASTGRPRQLGWLDGPSYLTQSAFSPWPLVTGHRGYKLRPWAKCHCYSFSEFLDFFANLNSKKFL
jgi:hypothetical protein